MVTGVQAERLSEIWPSAEPLIAKAMTATDSVDVIFKRLQEDDAQLWAIFEHGVLIAAVITEIITGDDGSKVCNIVAAGGYGINRWVDYAAMIEDWARESECTAVIVDHARRGLQRILTGYKVTHVTLGKAL